MSSLLVGSSFSIPLMVAFRRLPPSFAPTPTLPVIVVAPSLIITLPLFRPNIVKPDASPNWNTGLSTHSAETKPKSIVRSVELLAGNVTGDGFALLSFAVVLPGAFAVVGVKPPPGDDAVTV